MEKGESNKDVAGKYIVPMNTLSTWVKNKEKLFDALKMGTNVKRQKLKSGNYEFQELSRKAFASWLSFRRIYNIVGVNMKLYFN